jgi:ribosomal protein RSM22 (predicted rRNA methylase)
MAALPGSTSLCPQLFVEMAENGEEQAAMSAIQRSPFFEDLKARIIRQSSDGALDDIDQVALMKLGRFKERSWNMMKHAMKGHVDLWSPRKLRTVCTTGHTWPALIVPSNLASFMSAFVKRHCILDC